METKNNALIDSMIEMLEVLTDKKVDLDAEICKAPDFSNYLKTKVKTEMGGHIPQKNTVSDVKYCVNPDVVRKVLEST